MRQVDMRQVTMRRRQRDRNPNKEEQKWKTGLDAIGQKASDTGETFDATQVSGEKEKKERKKVGCVGTTKVRTACDVTGSDRKQ